MFLNKITYKTLNNKFL